MSVSQVKASAPISEEKEIRPRVKLQPVNFAVVGHRARGVRDQVLDLTRVAEPTRQRNSGGGNEEREREKRWREKREKGGIPHTHVEVSIPFESAGRQAGRAGGRAAEYHADLAPRSRPASRNPTNGQRETASARHIPGMCVR